MDYSISGLLISLILALLGALGSYFLLSSKEVIRTELYNEKIKKLTSNLEKSSEEVDFLLAELSEIAKTREEKVERIELDLANLQNDEKELKERIENLEKIPLPVAEYFAELIAQGEKRGAKRDYILFGAGAIVSIIIAITLKLVFRV